ncbi:Sacsin [Lachnellula occidentalis]|uniref:Sacsin n=1 Tax=Lachnellula occidentalis TaxID=215460 RepID=A0A8H8RJX0_9HELO|nr:Sacsin [Lachnellula occidentalis]
MAPQPIGHNAQVQPITTTLRNICRDYPAGGTVLRELLQNADDAGATEVRFILDERTHPTDELLHPLLAKYHGPALLAYNNAQFTDKDFTSLAHIGDSGKIDDGTTTGKFGRGFNSVYNWTDSPSIVSRDRILILDPHHEWSEGKSIGGPIYNFVQDHEDLAIKNTMAAYERVVGQFDRPLEGTVIRIPLRNPNQALKSDISSRTTTVQEMVEILKAFGDDFADHGLLFMRNVEKLELGTLGSSIVIEMTDGETLRSHKSKVNDAVKHALKDPNSSFDLSFQVTIGTKTGTELKQSAFIVHHCINGGLMDGSLRDWAATQNLLPWVAVAAPLLTKSTGNVNGSLFTVLPLPIESMQPVHIHGMFSLSPDRARLHHLSDRGTQDQNPAKWNGFLFKELVPVAWTQVLAYLAVLHPGQPAFEKWPQNIDGTRDHLSNALEDVLSVIERESLPLWPSSVGYVSSNDGLLYTGISDEALRESLQEAGAPVVYVPQQLQQNAQRLFEGNILGPETLCCFLRAVGNKAKLWSDETRHRIAEYLLTGPGFNDYGGLELFPYMDGSHHSIDDGITFIHRDDFEKSLFRLQESQNLDLEKFSEATQLFLKQGCENSSIHPSICFYSADSLGNYCRSTIFRKLPQDQDAIVLPQEAAAFVSNVWTWMLIRDIDVLDTKVSGLWLIPLSNGRHRKIKPGTSASQVYIAPEGVSGDLMRKIDSESSNKLLPLLDTRPSGLVPQSVSILLRNPDAKSILFIEDGSNLGSFLKWLHQTSPMLDGVADKDRTLVAKLIVSDLPKMLTPAECETVSGAVRKLKIFQKVSWTLEKNRMIPILTWANLSACKESFGLLDGVIPVPVIEGIQFILAKESSSSQQLLQTLGLKCNNTVDLIQNHIIPHWSSQKSKDWTPSSKEQLAEFILQQFSCLSLATQKKLHALPMVPVAKLDGKGTWEFACARELIDPSVLELTQLCFHDEGILPKKKFFDNFKVALKGCGLKIAVDKDVVQNRISCYAGSKYPFEEIRQRAHKLLKSEFTWTSAPNKEEYLQLRHLKWLPTVDVNSTRSLRASNECRGRRDRLLVNSQLPILDISISKEWQERLGWENTLSSQILMSQLKYGINNKDKSIVGAVLAYISRNKLTEQLTNDLRNLECVYGTSGSFILPSHAFCPPKQSISGYERLQPYVANVDRNFWEVHEELLLNIGVRDQLQLPDLIQIQTILQSKPVLDDADLAVAIEILNFASKFPRASLTNLKVVDKFRVFQPIHNINYDDLGLLKPKEKVNLTHEHIPMKAVIGLEIESLRTRLLKGMLKIEDVDDEDEFDQRESVTTCISDTLDRYTVETTFREYLANADDVQGTSEVGWLLDPRSHACKNLLTPEMGKFQGPALLVHNNGVFSDDDFEGFKNVGEGSKAQDKEKIGQFGRGSQTMYHWTDVPMILSGKFLLILDPRQEVLPKNQIKGKRKPGVKLALSKLREACGDQLAPFQDLWGYDQSQDSYPGTIFRFPLRAVKAKSVLRTNSKELNIAEVRRLMNNYFDEARVSLLFLRRIKSVDFSIQGDPDSGWSVTRLASVDEDAKSFSEPVTCRFTKNGVSAVAGRDRWWVCIEDLLPEVDRFPKITKRAMKNVECGLAALLSCKSDDAATPMPSKPLESRIFNTLPLPISSDLPVHVHANFLLSGDRQSISVDKYGAESHGAEWNRWLLQDALPKLYLTFLDDVGQQMRQEVFNFWPQEEPPKRSCAELLHASFWDQLPLSSQRIFPKAQPATAISQRRAAQLFDIKQAVFDFLPKGPSDILAPLLMSLGVNLVRHIPTGVSKHLKAMPNVKSVTGHMLRQLLKSARGGACLLNEMTNNPRTWEVLLDKLIPPDADLEDLDGCNILPLANGSLVSLKLIDAEAKQPSSLYYVASDEELKLFDFASTRLVCLKVGQKLERVLESGKFNLATLELGHMKTLLELRPMVTASDADSDSWLTTFWTMWESRKAAGNKVIEGKTIDASPDISDYDAKVFRASLNGSDLYASPGEFERLPAVVDSSIEEHQKLCDSIPGLYRFCPEFMPKSLADTESSFNKEPSFIRLIGALKLLAESRKIELETFIRASLDVSNLKVLQRLIVAHVAPAEPEKISKQVSGIMDLLKSIPVWPRFQNSPKEEFLSVNKSVMAANYNILVPWMKYCYCFIHPEFSKQRSNFRCLTEMAITKCTTEDALLKHVLPLPANLDDANWKYFQPLIFALSTSSLHGHVLQILRLSKIAVDGNRMLRLPSELYDHNDTIFISAFRNHKKSRFIHETLRASRTFWLEVGLRHRVAEVINASDYLHCLKIMSLRLNATVPSNDQYLSQDILTVLHLLTAPHSGTWKFTATDWAAISRERIFGAFTGFESESEYRRNTMESVAVQKPFLSLAEVVSHDHIPICWSQTSFASQLPTPAVLANMSGNGRPMTDMVWRHLLYLKDFADNLHQGQLPSFLADLHRTYEYLQDRLDTKPATFNLQNNAVWLNINSSDHASMLLEDVHSSWQTITELVLSSSCDAGPVKAVKSGLARYEKLLRVLGCTSIIYSTSTRPTLHQDASLGSSLRNMLKQEKQVDITYRVDGRDIKAHRLILAAVSEKCAGQFKGDFHVEEVIVYDKATDPDDPSYHTLSNMIKYAYEDEIDWPEMEVVESDSAAQKKVKLDLLLDLHKGADCWLMSALASQVEDKILVAGRVLINLENVLEVRKRALNARALEVESMCAKFTQQNIGAVMKAHGGKLE